MELLQIENKSGKVKLNDSIFKESVDKLLDEIGSVFSAKAVAAGANFGNIMNCADNAADSMEFEIHSPGGSVMEGYRVYQAIKELRARGVHVTAFINSLAASMGSVVAMAADEIKIVKGGRMMIHEASTATWGNAEDHARNAKLLDEMSAEIAGIYAERTGKKASEMRERMKEETWMSAETAVAEGFADEVVSGKFDTTKKEMTNFVDRLKNPSSEEAIARIAELENAAQAHESAVAEIQAKLTDSEARLQEAATATLELSNSIATKDAEITTLKAEVAKIPDLEAAAKLTADRVKLEAANVAASIGLSEALPDNGTESASKTTHLDTFNTLSGPEKSAYYQANSEAIRKEMTL